VIDYPSSLNNTPSIPRIISYLIVLLSHERNQTAMKSLASTDSMSSCDNNAQEFIDTSTFLYFLLMLGWTLFVILVGGLFFIVVVYGTKTVLSLIAARKRMKTLQEEEAVGRELRELHHGQRTSQA
jgi:hypothetical protein